jgi:hypothetical protein
MGRQDWKRIEKELNEVLAKLEFVGDKRAENLDSFSDIGLQQDVSSRSAKNSAEAVLEHIARALEEFKAIPCED